MAMSEAISLRAVSSGPTKLTAPFGAHANAVSRNGEEQRLASTPVASPDDADDILAADSCSGQSWGVPETLLNCRFIRRSEGRSGE